MKNIYISKKIYEKKRKINLPGTGSDKCSPPLSAVYSADQITHLLESSCASTMNYCMTTRVRYACCACYARCCVRYRCHPDSWQLLSYCVAVDLIHGGVQTIPRCLLSAVLRACVSSCSSSIDCASTVPSETVERWTTKKTGIELGRRFHRCCIGDL